MPATPAGARNETHADMDTIGPIVTVILAIIAIKDCVIPELLIR